MHPFEISHTTLMQWQKESKSFSLIDIREKQEREQMHIGGIWIPLSSMAENIDTIPSTLVVLYCRSGVRSLATAIKLREKLSRDNIFSLEGGITATN